MDKIDDEIRAASADSSKKAYERYKAAYLATNPEVHSEESVLSFLQQCKEEKGYLPTTLWTVRSHIASFLKLERKVEVSDSRTSTWIKKLERI